MKLHLLKTYLIIKYLLLYIIKKQQIINTVARKWKLLPFPNRVLHSILPDAMSSLQTSILTLSYDDIIRFSLLLRFPMVTMLTFCTIIRKRDHKKF